MRSAIKHIAILFLLLTLTACKIDLSIIGLGTVKTDTGSIDCTTGTTGDCHQEYVTDLNDCDDPAHCTLVSGAATENFTALPGDDNTFGGWGDLCFGIADVKCQHTITDEYAADQNGQLNVTATFDTEPEPQSATYSYDVHGSTSAASAWMRKSGQPPRPTHQ